MYLSDEEWKKRLTKKQFEVLRQKATETPFSGEYVDTTADGAYVCAACGAVLFDSSTKFDAHCGWPSFYEAKPGSVAFHNDTSHGMVRTEVTCAKCGGHLGHIFPDAPEQPGGMRYCINSISLDFKPKQK